MFSGRRFRSHSYAGRWAGNEYGYPGRLQFGLETGFGFERASGQKTLGNLQRRAARERTEPHAIDRSNVPVPCGSEWFLSFLRTNVIPSVAPFLLSLDTVKNFIFPLISQIGINYRHGSLSRHSGDEDFHVKAGDRMPYFLVEGQSVYDKLHAPQFHLLNIVDRADIHDGDQLLKKQLESEYGELVDFNTVSLDDKVREVFGSDKPFNVLLRPDNYIGALSKETTLSGVEVYLRDFIRHAP